MSARTENNNGARDELLGLEQQIIALGNVVESLLADSVVALMERSPEMADGLRQDDCVAHDRWLDIEKACMGLLAEGELNAEQVRFVTVGMQISTDLKWLADEAMRIGEGIRACQPGVLAEAVASDSLPRMVELTQSMMGDVLEALVERDAEGTNGLHLVFRELSALNGETAEELAQGMADGRVPAPLGATLIGTAQRLERIGDEVLDISNQVGRLYRRNNG